MYSIRQKHVINYDHKYHLPLEVSLPINPKPKPWTLVMQLKVLHKARVQNITDDSP